MDTYILVMVKSRTIFVLFLATSHSHSLDLDIYKVYQKCFKPFQSQAIVLQQKTVIPPQKKKKTSQIAHIVKRGPDKILRISHNASGMEANIRVLVT